MGPRAQPETGPDPVSPDSLLSDEGLIALAMRELKGRRPPRLGEERDPWDTTIPAVTPQTTTRTPRTLLARELEARGWTARDLAKAAGISPMEANALAKGNARMTRTLAETLARVFATSPEFWL